MIPSDKFISYAQNCEDVMLWRALRNVEQGYYIDVGAAEPIAESVTYAFYLRGWRGINIEPVAGAFARLCAERPRDINLNYAIGDRDGPVPFFLVEGGNGLSTAVEDQVTKLRSQGWASVPSQVDMRRLSTVIDYHMPEIVHFLKIDVEGAERAVLESVDLKTFRPWIILVEATEPNSTTPSHNAWEPLLIDANYTFVWFDGLNRFYVASEKADLAAAFSAPPNVFDGYIRQADAVAADQHLTIRTDLEAELARVIAERDGLSAALDQISRDRGDLEMQVNQHKVEVGTQDAALSQLSKVKDGLEVQLNHASAERDNLVAEVERLRQSRGDLEAKLAEAAVDREIQVAASQQMRKAQHGLQAEVARIVAERDSWAQELFETNRYAAVVTEQRHRFASENEILTNEQARLREEGDSLRGMNLALREENELSLREKALLDAENEALRREKALLEAENVSLDRQEASLRRDNEALRHDQAALRASTSWRISAPIRVIARALRGR